MRPRIAIYARHSTIFQNRESSNDQVRACEPLVERLGGTVVSVHTGIRRCRVTGAIGRGCRRC